MKSTLALAAFILSLSTYSFAATEQNEIKCPDIKDLKAAQFSDANSVYDTNLWEVIQPSSQFGTKNAWRFKVNIEADDKSGAMKQASAALGSMRLIHGPEKVENEWMCHYRSGQHDAVAILTLPGGEQNTVASAEQAESKKKPA